MEMKFPFKKYPMLNGEEQNIIGYPTRGNVFSSVIPSHFISITSFPFSLTLVIPGFPSSHSVLFDGGKSFVIFSLVFLSFSLPIAPSLCSFSINTLRLPIVRLLLLLESFISLTLLGFSFCKGNKTLFCH